MAQRVTQGSRRGRVPRVGSEIKELLVEESVVGVGWLSEVSTSAISKILHRIGQASSK